MKMLISVSSHKRYRDILQKYNIPFDLPSYIPEKPANNVSGIRPELIGRAGDCYILYGTFYAEEYEYLSSNDAKLFELQEIEWGEDYAKKRKLQQTQKAGRN